MKMTHVHGPRASRRAFFGNVAAATAATATGVFSPRSARADEGDDEDNEHGGQPNPIPGGVAPFAPFGVFIHHFPLNPAVPLASMNDPSQITDFNGFVGGVHILGGGTGTNTITGATTDLAYRADMGFSQGQFIGTDGKRHHGTFAFVWLDLYTGQVGSANLTEQIHDYNVHIDANDVFWMVRIKNDAVDVDFDLGRARLRVRRLGVFDDHDVANSLTDGLGLPGDLGFPYPHIPPVFPTRAVVSFNIEWNGIISAAQISNAAQRFKGSFLETGATISWSAEQPGFRFQSEAPNPARNSISVLGREQNGVFF